MKRRRISVVDDSQSALEFTRDVLEAMGHEVSTHASPFGLHVSIKLFQPEIVLLDIEMPALNGPAVCKLLKATELKTKPMVVLYSALSDEEMSRLSKDCSADGFFRKTTDAQELSRHIQHYLYKHQRYSGHFAVDVVGAVRPRSRSSKRP